MGNRLVIDLLKNATTLVTTSCTGTADSTDLEVFERSIRHAKKSYACALRYAGRLSFSLQDVRDFELRSVELEKVIAQLEQTKQLSIPKVIRRL